MRRHLRLLGAGTAVFCVLLQSGCTTLRQLEQDGEPYVVPEPAAQPLWATGHPPVAKGTPAEKTVNRTTEQNALGLNRSISHVSIPTIAIHRPEEPCEDAAAVVVCPGGAFRRVVIDKEGHDVARWLSRHGIVGVVLKYRTGPMGAPACLEDARQAIRFVRVHADELGVSPRRIGIMGFSAGGHLALRAALHPQVGNPEADDPVERVSSRPDFACMVYPAVPEDMADCVSPKTPPAFFVHSYDDGVPVDGSVQCFRAWKKASVRAEAHLYATGGHAYGLGVRGGAVASWPDRFIDWLVSLKLLQEEGR
ncbi:MAG: alpha/beta hydrolase [Lentisphaerae bacterium]|jgi:acetyl esterase/lipase|nr:alpha/beta hydrolase [Lentisphaerota bacterium]MBT4820245.1 alpha/beta hydrolase [Lentisphaerota bacterium]MBT5606020.1 alpha/beta hydrolase [Lentisphaerota bacterium]MBT7058591.1 alpha/beta hydrolase [Lentisphaerota bacterium]MBT7845459.1 alpha/beta hydrolase [Lentisphaerota bacterium]